MRKTKNLYVGGKKMTVWRKHSSDIIVYSIALALILASGLAVVRSNSKWKELTPYSTTELTDEDYQKLVGLFEDVLSSQRRITVMLFDMSDEINELMARVEKLEGKDK